MHLFHRQHSEPAKSPSPPPQQPTHPSGPHPDQYFQGPGGVEAPQNGPSGSTSLAGPGREKDKVSLGQAQAEADERRLGQMLE
ncbi:hypothetical protein JCM8547_004374 [Rhodosporidiobolus lusitaniae]